MRKKWVFSEAISFSIKKLFKKKKMFLMFFFHIQGVPQPGIPGNVREFIKASGKLGIGREFDVIFRSRENLKISKLFYVYIYLQGMLIVFRV